MDLYKFEFTQDAKSAATNLSMHKRSLLFTANNPVEAVRDTVLYVEALEVADPDFIALYGSVSKVNVSPIDEDGKCPSSEIVVFKNHNGGSYADWAKEWVLAMKG